MSAPPSPREGGDRGPGPGTAARARRRAGELERRGVLAGLEPPWTVAGAVRIGEHVSGRRFYRLFPEEGSGGAPATLVLVTYEPDDLEIKDRHVRATRWLEDAGVPVPALHDVGERGLLVGDGGDRLLADGAVPGGRRRAYEAAVDVIRRLQRHGREAPAPNPGDALDRARLTAELEFFERHTVRGWMGAGAGAERRRAGYAALVDAVCRLPVALCHRDFHARNLLVGDGGTLMVVDFQDLMEGPFLYDLASLVWDNYCDVPSEVQAIAVERFWRGCEVDEDGLVRAMGPGRVEEAGTIGGGQAEEAAAMDGERADGAGTRGAGRAAARAESGRAGDGGIEPLSGLPGAARRAFCQVAAQRHLKALGTFGYQVTRGGRPAFGRFAPRTWGHARRALRALGMDDLLSGLAALERLEDPGCL